MKKRELREFGILVNPKRKREFSIKDIGTKQGKGSQKKKKSRRGGTVERIRENG